MNWWEKWKIVDVEYICSTCGGSGKIHSKHPLATGDLSAECVYCPTCDSLGTTATSHMERIDLTGGSK